MKTNRILLIFFFISCNLFAQSGKFQEKRAQIKSMKIGFITTELNLTTDEAARFWPVYNAFDEKQQDLRQRKLRSFMDRMENGTVDKMSDKEATIFLSQLESTEDEMYDLRKKFISNLKGIIPAMKIIRLKKAEEDFNRKLLKQYREKRQ